MKRGLSELIRVVEVSAEPSERLLRACAAFGLGVRHVPHNPQAGRTCRVGAAREIVGTLRAGELALLTGPSGGGKSSLLAEVGMVARRRSGRVLTLPDPHSDAPIIDVVDGPLGEALATLARAGLGDAMLLGRSAAQLSDGERFRLRLALAMAACLRHSATTSPAGPVTLLIDEFASTVDRTTARCLCTALRRWMARAKHPLRVIVATAHHDVAQWLAPELTVIVPLGHAPVQISRAGRSKATGDAA